MVLDIIFVSIFIWAIYKGYTKGLIFQLATLSALVLGLFGAMRFSNLTSLFLINKLGWNGEYISIIAFAITFLGIVILVHLFAKALQKLMEAIALGLVNRLLGIAFSVAKSALIISALLLIVNSVNQYATIIPPEQSGESKLYNPLSRLAPAVFPYLKSKIAPKDSVPSNKQP